MDSSDSPRSRPLVLVVDDSPVQRRIITEELCDLDVVTVQAENGAEALTRIAACRPDLVTLDINMPVLSGDQVVRILKSSDQTARIPVVMISGQPSDVERHRLLELGAIEYFHKPFPTGALRSVVVEVLRQVEVNRDTIIFALEGNDEARQNLGAILRTHGYAYRLFSEVQPLVDALAHEHCDLLLLDLHFSGQASFKILEQLQYSQGHALMATLGLTTASARRHLGNAFRFGLDDFVRRPFYVEELLARIEHHVRLKQERAHLARVATVDCLTGLHNRREVTRCLEVEAERARRDRRDFGVLMLDIDHFKRLNDELGHPFGDRVLRGVSTALRESTRVTDVVGRYGGEEFIILLPGTTEQELVDMGERLRMAVSGLEFEEHGSVRRVTISVGGCLWAHDALKVQPQLEAFVLPADRALYQAKAAGRDRVMVVSREMTRSQLPAVNQSVLLKAAGV